MEQINELFETLVQQKITEINRAKWRAQFKKYYDANPEKIKLYYADRQKDYYQKNKERLNALRTVNRRKAKAKQQLQDEMGESLAKT